MMGWRRKKVSAILIIPVVLLGLGAGLATGGNVSFGVALAVVGLVLLVLFFVWPRMRRGGRPEP
ncbi:MAG: hypothetical protein ABI334_07620 [Candidatus Dormiibacterota bacterium]